MTINPPPDPVFCIGDRVRVVGLPRWDVGNRVIVGDICIVREIMDTDYGFPCYYVNPMFERYVMKAGAWLAPLCLKGVDND